MPKLSIIVPVYNTEKYLPKCIDSILDQSFTDFELLLIDDGSKDKSASICDAYAGKDARVRVFHKENEGVSRTRNLGLDNATGEWIYFIDSDDELIHNGLNIIMNHTSEEVDMVIAGFEEYNDDGNCRYAVSTRKVETFSPSESVLICYEKYSLYYRYLGYLWIRLFRKDLIEKMELRFDESITVKEDTLFIVQYLCGSKKETLFTTEPIYKYYRHATSIMTSLWGKWDEKYISSFFSVQKMYYAIRCSFSQEKGLIKVAQEEEIDRFNRIINKQKQFDSVDTALQKQLYNIIVNDLGLLFILKYKIRSISSKIGKKFKRL